MSSGWDTTICRRRALSLMPTHREFPSSSASRASRKAIRIADWFRPTSQALTRWAVAEYLPSIELSTTSQIQRYNLTKAIGRHTLKSKVEMACWDFTEL